MSFPLRTTFAASPRFCKVVISLSFVSTFMFYLSFMFYDFLFDFIFDSLVFLAAYCLVSLDHFFSHFSFCGWFLVIYCCSQNARNIWMFEIISILLNLCRLVLCPNMWSILENVPCMLEKNVYSGFFLNLFFWCISSIPCISNKFNFSIIPLRISVASLLFCLEDLSFDVSRVLRSPFNISVGFDLLLLYSFSFCWSEKFYCLFFYSKWQFFWVQYPRFQGFSFQDFEFIMTFLLSAKFL